ncbi:15493_t:CDS:2, partial [Entrophospora sp. SA101]
NGLSEVEGNLNDEIREGDEESDNGSNESDTTIELYDYRKDHNVHYVHYANQCSKSCIMPISNCNGVGGGVGDSGFLWVRDCMYTKACNNIDCSLSPIKNFAWKWKVKSSNLGDENLELCPTPPSTPLQSEYDFTDSEEDPKSELDSDYQPPNPAL